jgi:hypothetical protein
MAEAGFFRLRGVLVGTAAFQTYSALLGVRLPDSAMQTGDADFAQFHAISAAVDDSMPPVLDVIRQVDETFREIPHPSGGPGITRYVARSGFQVEFLTPNTGSTLHDGKPARMPALGGAAATPLRFLDFLIHQPVRGILLHGFGVPVLVPAPERFAVHKLILSARRRTDRDGTAKSLKDLRQAGLVAEALAVAKQQSDLAAAYAEAWDRGPAWRDAMLQGLAGLDPATRSALLQAVDAGLRTLGDDPGTYELDGDGVPVHGRPSDAEPRHD